MTRAPRTDREARLALAAVVPSSERAGVVHEVHREGALATWRTVLDGPPEETTTRRARALDLDEVVAETMDAGARFVVPGDAEWPVGADDLDHPRVDVAGGVPLGLWITGRPLVLHRPVAVVGSRASTGYGNVNAEALASCLTERGHTVVASLAYGIDVSALTGAMVAAAADDAPPPTTRRRPSWFWRPATPGPSSCAATSASSTSSRAAPPSCRSTGPARRSRARAPSGARG